MASNSYQRTYDGNTCADKCQQEEYAGEQLIEGNHRDLAERS